MTKITEQHSQRKSLFSNNFQKTNLVIGGCVQTTHPDIFFAGGRRNYYNALIEILLLVTTTVAGEFCHQQVRCIFWCKLNEARTNIPFLLFGIITCRAYCMKQVCPGPLSIFSKVNFFTAFPCTSTTKVPYFP